VYQTFHETPRRLGLVSNRDQETEICLQNVIDLNRLASDIRFRLAQMAYYGDGRNPLETRFCHHLADDGEASAAFHPMEREKWVSPGQSF
jgi:hypothetical protein